MWFWWTSFRYGRTEKIKLPRLVISLRLLRIRIKYIIQWHTASMPLPNANALWPKRTSDDIWWATPRSHSTWINTNILVNRQTRERERDRDVEAFLCTLTTHTYRGADHVIWLRGGNLYNKIKMEMNEFDQFRRYRIKWCRVRQATTGGSVDAAVRRHATRCARWIEQTNKIIHSCIANIDEW